MEKRCAYCKKPIPGTVDETERGSDGICLPCVKLTSPEFYDVLAAKFGVPDAA